MSHVTCRDVTCVRVGYLRLRRGARIGAARLQRGRGGGVVVGAFQHKL